MKKVVYIITILFVLSNVISCQKDFLEKEPLDQFAEESVWNDPALVETFVNNIYFGIPHGYNVLMLSTLVDESMAVWDWETSNVTKSLVTPSYYGPWATDWWGGNRYEKMNWTNSYKNIRACNLFFEQIDDAPFDDEELKTRLKGEVHFLRAYLYHNLVSLYGGVPIIADAYDLHDEYAVPRNTYEESIQFIAEEADKAAGLLPLTNTDDNKGRGTQGAALALKARTLLYAASDLFHNQNQWAPGYSNPEYVGYVGGDRTARWQAAKDAAKAVMELGTYSLYKADPAPGDSTAANYAEIFTLKETSEDIFIRYFLPKTNEDWDGYNPGLYNGPNGYHNWGGNTPLGQLVDDYEMANGSRFDWSNPEHAAAPYQNRDPRFYATVLYEGANWRKRPTDVYELDPKGIIQIGFWEVWDPAANEIDVIPGLDTRKGPIEDWNGTYTGYYLRKFMDQTVDAQFTKQDLPWRLMRYTEVLLNYAEACLGLGQEEEARQYINMIRNRAGMPPVNDSGQDLVDRYRNERRIELAYEDHRYFDVRRWMIAPQVYTNAQGINAVYELDQEDKTTADQPTYSVIEVQDRAWLERAYFLPIRLDEINRNNKLVQNPLY